MDSVIFDLDGTIWDPVDTVVHAWNSCIRERRQVKKELTRADVEQTMGLQMEEISITLFPDLHEEDRKQLTAECFDAELGYLEKQGGMLYPNVEKVLQSLAKRYKLCIVSNCQEGYIEAFYKAHNLGRYFADEENAGRTGLSKGENIKLVIDRNRLSNPVYVGDTEGDSEASRYAGVPFVYAAYRFANEKAYGLNRRMNRSFFLG